MRKLSKEAYSYIINTIKENGSMSTDEAVELVRPYYDFDSGAAWERELRRYVGQLMRSQRDSSGVRTMFLDKESSEIVDIDHCTDYGKVSAVVEQLRTHARGNYRSYRKAAKRIKAIAGQIEMFDENALLRDLSAAI